MILSKMKTIDLLLRKSAKLLALLQIKEKRWYTANLAKESGMTYAYAKKIISEFKSAGLLSVEKVGKFGVVVPTQDGLKLATHLKEIIEMLKNDNSRN